MDDIVIREARADEADELAPALTDLCRRSKAHWGYRAEMLARWADDLRIRPADIRDDTVLIATAGVGPSGTPRVSGFARVAARDDHAQLCDLWLEPGYIGTGLGRRLWDAAVSVARTLPFRELRFAADPNAEPFYARMGARRIGDVPSEVIEGRTLGLWAFQLRPTVETTPGPGPGPDLSG